MLFVSSSFAFQEDPSASATTPTKSESTPDVSRVLPHRDSRPVLPRLPTESIVRSVDAASSPRRTPRDGTEPSAVRSPRQVSPPRTPVVSPRRVRASGRGMRSSGDPASPRAGLSSADSADAALVTAHIRATEAQPQVQSQPQRSQPPARAQTLSPTEQTQPQSAGVNTSAGAEGRHSGSPTVNSYSAIHVRRSSPHGEAAAVVAAAAALASVSKV
jgi:hypothetical protein